MPRPRNPLCARCGADDWGTLPGGGRRCRQCDSRRHRVADRQVRWLGATRQRAKRDGIAFDLKSEELSVPEVCPVLGIPLFRQRGNGPRDNSPSLDRIDPSKGYTKDNVRVISYRANRIKGNCTAAELRAIAAYAEGGI